LGQSQCVRVHVCACVCVKERERKGLWLHEAGPFAYTKWPKDGRK